MREKKCLPIISKLVCFVCELFIKRENASLKKTIINLLLSFQTIYKLPKFDEWMTEVGGGRGGGFLLCLSPTFDRSFQAAGHFAPTKETF